MLGMGSVWGYDYCVMFMFGGSCMCWRDGRISGHRKGWLVIYTCGWSIGWTFIRKKINTCTLENNDTTFLFLETAPGSKVSFSLQNSEFRLCGVVGNPCEKCNRMKTAGTIHISR